MQRNPANQYLRQRVETATPAELIGMLYDAGTSAIRSGLTALEGGDRPEMCRHFLRSQDVIMELRCALNPDAGEIARNLDSIYAYLFQRLVDANIRRDAGAAREALALLTSLQETWREAVLGQAVPQPATTG
jgi:flagellar secretion chaperone FliS